MSHLVAFLALVLILVNFAQSDGWNPMSHPRAGETVIAEQPYEIEWNNGTAGPVGIGLHDGGNTYISLAAETVNNGSYTLIFSGVFAGKNNYFLAICDLKIQNECTYTDNGRFAIQSASLSSSNINPGVPISGSVPETLTPSVVVVTIASSISSPATPMPTQRSTTSSGTTASTSTPPATSAPTSSGLSAGAKAGIGIGCTFGGMACILIGLWIFLWRPKRHPDAHSSPVIHERAELPGDSGMNGQGKHGDKMEASPSLALETNPERDEIHELPELVADR